MKDKLKFIIPLIFILALALGLLQREQDPYVSGNTNNSELYKYFKAAEDLGAKQQTPKSEVTFLAVGDIMLSRNVAGTIQKAKDPLLPFSGMKDILNSVDFNFGNLESPISGRDHFSPTGSMVFNVPTAYASGLNAYNFQVLSLANNHALDQGEKGLFYTLDFLKQKGIKTIGAGKNLEEAWRPAVVEKNGIKICFIGASYSSINDNGKATNEFVARIQNIDSLKSSILNLKSACDFVVASMHAGTEYVTKPNKDQVAFAHAAIDAGADMVIGHHPHWVQTIEHYCPSSAAPMPDLGDEGANKASDLNKSSINCTNPKYIFYSLGNFIFDQMWSFETRQGLALKIRVSKSETNTLQGPKTPAKLESIELLPLIIDNYSTPRPANEIESKRILDTINIKDKILK